MGDRPNISSFTVQDERNATEMVNLTQHNFNVAFAVQKIEGDDFEPIGDPDYVQWLAYFYTETKHEKNYTLVNVHKCTEEDFEYFHEVTEYQKYIVEEMKKKDMFFCLDKDDQFGNPVDMTMYGAWEIHYHRSLSIIYRPCQPKQRTELNQHESCLIDDVKNKT